jgi:UDP:flavonoid glycosyltransferase YjiC (YdhE family)
MVLEFIPLSNLIEDIDLMLNHGGIGTIKECIENKVPMIVLPLNKKTDQPGCGARTVSNGLGKVFHLNKLNKNDIKNSIFQQINCV